MSPLDAEMTVALHVEEMLRRHEASRLGLEASRAARSDLPESDADPPHSFQPVRQAVGEALIRIGLWMTGGAPVPIARS